MQTPGARRRRGWMLVPVLVLAGLGGVAQGSIPEDPDNLEQWVARYNGPANSSDRASSTAMAPDGSKVFVTGSSHSSATDWCPPACGDDAYATVAYSTGTGDELWVARYNGPGNFGDYASSLAVAPDGSKVFVTGSSYGSGSSYDYATIAYSTATGAELWVARYKGPANFGDYASSLAVAPDGSKVFVTGSSDSSAPDYWCGHACGDDAYATVAYSTATGDELWVARYNGPGNSYDFASSLAVAPDGSKVFVTGGSSYQDYVYDYATVAYSTATGAELWVARYNGPGNSSGYASSLAVAPDGSKVFVTGTSIAGISIDPPSVPLPICLIFWCDVPPKVHLGYDRDYATVAYSTATGAELWVARYNGPANSSSDYASSVAAAPDGSKVFVTGSSSGVPGVCCVPLTTDYFDYATVAYSTAIGTQLWVARYNGPGDYDWASSVAVAPDGSKVFVTGFSAGSRSDDYDYDYDYATVAYSTAIGTQLWAARYGSGGGYDGASSLAVAPDGSKVFVTGHGYGDYATVAYRATSCDNGKDETGPASGLVNQVEPLTGPTAAPYVHGVNCEVVAANGL